MRLDEAYENKIEDTLEHILKRKEFTQSNSENALYNYITQLIDRIMDWIRSFFKDRIDDSLPDFEPAVLDDKFETVLRVGIIVVFAVVLFLIIKFLVKKLYLPKKVIENSDMLPHEFLKNPNLVLNKVSEYFNLKEYTTALRYLFIATLLRLNDKKIIRIEKWKTNRIYLREINNNYKKIYTDMLSFTSLFNDCLYGRKTVEEKEITPWLDFYEKLNVIDNLN